MSAFRGLVPGLIPSAEGLYRLAHRMGLQPRVTSVRRSRQQQAVLYSRYLRGQSPFPAAPPGRSKHEIGLAFDLVCSDPGWLGAVWREAGGGWSPSDPIHFEA